MSLSGILGKRYKTSEASRGPVPPFFNPLATPAPRPPSYGGFTDTSKYAPKAPLGKRRSFVSEFAGPVAKKLHARGGKASSEYARHFNLVTGMPKRFARRRSVGATKRRRFTRGSKSPRRFGSRSARPLRSFRSFGRRRFKRRNTALPSKSFARKVMMAAAQDKSWQRIYADSVSVAQTSQQDAGQAMWANNQIQSGGSGAAPKPSAYWPAQACSNLGIMDPHVLDELFDGEFKDPTNELKPTTAFYIKSWVTHCRVTNIQTTPMEFFEYRCRCRRSAPQQTSSSTPKNLDALLFYSGDSEATGANLTKLLPQYYGTTPFDFPRWCKEIKVLKSRSFNLAPGESKEFTYKMKGSRWVKHNDLQQQVGAGTAGSESLLGWMKGQTFSLFCMRGTWAFNNLTAPVPDPNNAVGVGGAACGIVYKYKIHYRKIEPTVRTTVNRPSLPAVVGGVSAAPVMVVSASMTGSGGTVGMIDTDMK